MSDQMTLMDLPSVISSQASGAGPTPCDLRGGPMTDQSGQDRVHAKAGQRLVSA